MKLTLSEWEKELRLQIAGGDVLLGQLPLGGPPYDEADMESLGHLLKKEFAKRPVINKVLGIIEKHYPLSFALYLVLQGVFNYQRGNYWSAVASKLSLAGDNSCAACGQTFRQILKKYRLPTFEHIEGLKNLVPILAHGGIPNYSLDDFFQLLDRSTKDSLITVDAETLLEEWSNDPDETFSLIDRPVKRFVLHGGPVAEDFVTRCLVLIELDAAEEIAELALPQRVADRYRGWREKQTDSQLQRDRIQLSRPVLYLDPYEGNGVCLELPPQKFPANIAFQNLTWLMEAGGKQREILCDRDRTANGYEFSVPETVLVPASSDYTISIRRNGAGLRTWALAGMGTPPLLIFDRGTGNLLKDNVRRHPGERWVMYPDDFRLTVKGGRKIGELPQQFGEWGRYAVEEWDLASGSKLELAKPGQPVHSLDIVDEPALRRPFFEGGFRPLEHRTRGKFALYSGPPPNLVITFPTNPDSQQLARWRITVASEGSSRPANRRSYLLSELHPQLRIENNNRVVLNLSSPHLLGQDPCGTFEINAQGPFGRGGRLGLRIVPELRIQGHKALYLSAKDGPAKLELECAGHSRIQCTVVSGVEFEALPGATHHYKVIVTPSVPAVKFIFIDRQEVRVPFTIPIRRLRWALWQSHEPDRFAWKSVPLRINPQTLPDIYETQLYVDLPTLVGDARLFGGWRLLDGHGTVLMERQPDLTRSRQQYIILLAELMSSFRLAQENGDSLCLQIWVCREDTELQDYFGGF